MSFPILFCPIELKRLWSYPLRCLGFDVRCTSAELSPLLSGGLNAGDYTIDPDAGYGGIVIANKVSVLIIIQNEEDSASTAPSGYLVAHVVPMHGYLKQRARHVIGEIERSFVAAGTVGAKYSFDAMFRIPEHTTDEWWRSVFLAIGGERWNASAASHVISTAVTGTYPTVTLRGAEAFATFHIGPYVDLRTGAVRRYVSVTLHRSLRRLLSRGWKRELLSRIDMAFSAAGSSRVLLESEKEVRSEKGVR